MEPRIVRHLLKSAHERLVAAGYDYQAKRIVPVLQYVEQLVELQEWCADRHLDQSYLEREEVDETLSGGTDHDR